MLTIHTTNFSYPFRVTLCTNAEIMRCHWEEFGERDADTDACATTLLADKFRSKLAEVFHEDGIDYEDSFQAWNGGRFSDCTNYGMQFKENANFVIPGYVYKQAEVLLGWAFQSALRDAREFVRVCVGVNMEVAP